MNIKLLVRGMAALSVMMACAACRVTLESDLQNPYEASSRRSGVSRMVLVAMQETPEAETKTSLNGLQVLWSAEDKIKVFNAANPGGVVFSLKAESAGQSVGEFTGDIIGGDGPFYAVYPAGAAGTLTGDAVSIAVPQTQTLTSGSFGNGANIAVAKVNNLSEDLSFKNVLGAVCIQLSGTTDVSRIRIQTKGAERLWGSGTVAMSEGTPTLTLDAGTTDNQILEATGAASGTAFYLMLPPDALAGGFIIQVAVGESAMLKEAPATERNKIARSGIVAMPAFGFVSQLPSSFLNISATPFGYWAAFGSEQTFTFNKATSQYATKVGETDQTFRMQDFTTQKMFSFVLPKTLPLGLSGEGFDTRLESVVGSEYAEPSSAGTFRLVQKTSSAGWFVSSDNTKGFIISLED